MVDPGLTSAERNKLVGILARLGSDFDGERAAAGLLATRMLRALGLNWDAVIAGRAVMVQPRRPWAAHDVRVDLHFCARHVAKLSEWEITFVCSLGRQRGPLSPKQTATISKVAAGLRARGLT